MIEFKAVTIRRFKTKRAFFEFMIYLKGHVTPEVYTDLMKKGHATRTDTTELDNEVETCSAWSVHEVKDK